MLFKKKILSEDEAGRPKKLSLDDLEEVTGGMTDAEYYKRLAQLDSQTWGSRDEYVDALADLIKEYQSPC